MFSRGMSLLQNPSHLLHHAPTINITLGPQWCLVCDKVIQPRKKVEGITCTPSKTCTTIDQGPYCSEQCKLYDLDNRQKGEQYPPFDTLKSKSLLLSVLSSAISRQLSISSAARSIRLVVIRKTAHCWLANENETGKVSLTRYHHRVHCTRVVEYKSSAFNCFLKSDILRCALNSSPSPNVLIPFETLIVHVNNPLSRILHCLFSTEDGPITATEAHWSPSVKSKSRGRYIDSVQPSTHQSEWKLVNEFLRPSSDQSSTFTFRIPGYPHALKWKGVGTSFWCLAAFVEDPIAIFEPSVGLRLGYIEDFETLFDKDDVRPMFVHQDVSVLLDCLLISALLLVTDAQKIDSKRFMRPQRRHSFSGWPNTRDSSFYDVDTPPPVYDSFAMPPPPRPSSPVNSGSSELSIVECHSFCDPMLRSNLMVTRTLPPQRPMSTPCENGLRHIQNIARLNGRSHHNERRSHSLPPERCYEEIVIIVPHLWQVLVGLWPGRWNPIFRPYWLLLLHHDWGRSIVDRRRRGNLVTNSYPQFEDDAADFDDWFSFLISVSSNPWSQPPTSSFGNASNFGINGSTFTHGQTVNNAIHNYNHCSPIAHEELMKIVEDLKGTISGSETRQQQCIRLLEAVLQVFSSSISQYPRILDAPGPEPPPNEYDVKKEVVCLEIMRNLDNQQCNLEHKVVDRRRELGDKLASQRRNLEHKLAEQRQVLKCRLADQKWGLGHKLQKDLECGLADLQRDFQCSLADLRRDHNHGLADLQQELKHCMTDLRILQRDLKCGLTKLRRDLKCSLAELQQCGLVDRLQESELGLANQWADLKQDLEELERDLADRRGELELDLAKAQYELERELWQDLTDRRRNFFLWFISLLALGIASYCSIGTQHYTAPP